MGKETWTLALVVVAVRCHSVRHSFYDIGTHHLHMSKIIMTIDTRPLARAIERSVRKTTCKPSFAMRVKKKFVRKAKFFCGWDSE